MQEGEVVCVPAAASTTRPLQLFHNLRGQDAGLEESQCGWCKERLGRSWQITPRVLTDALAAGGGEAKRAFEAMMPMQKIDIATIEAARRGK